jgi:integrase
VSTIPNYYRATKLFCEMNDVILSWKKIARGMERVRKAANDRAPTLEEIRRVIEYPDRRIKPIVYAMVSSGIRIGVWDYLRWKHVSPITNDKGEIIAAKLVVYAGDPEEYYAFLTPESYNSLRDWMDFRASYGAVVVLLSIPACRLFSCNFVALISCGLTFFLMCILENCLAYA